MSLITKSNDFETELNTRIKYWELSLFMKDILKNAMATPQVE